jgi:Peptidase MA superfamily
VSVRSLAVGWMLAVSVGATPGVAAAQTEPAPPFRLDSLDGVRYGRLPGGRATLFFAPSDSLVAREVLALLDRESPLPGLPDSLPLGVRAVLAHSPAAFDELTGGSVPEWRAGVAIPEDSLLVVPTGEGPRVLDADGRRTLRHEWAHLGLHQAVAGLRVPRWFDEGYAQWASGGFDATQAWRLRLLIALGRTPEMDSLALRWPSGRVEAETAYLLSASAVTFLLADSGPRGLALFLARWERERSFERAFRTTFGVTTSQFEEDWRKHVEERYGWLFVLSHSALFWLVLALVLLFMLHMRQGRDRERLARLRAEEPPDEPAYWEATDAPDGPMDPTSGVGKEP